MRWFDIKRYGIKIYRRQITSALNLLEITDSMSYRDPRQAFQIPFEVRGAGLEANPRPAGEAIIDTESEAYREWQPSGSTIKFSK
jgi:hypothetical protein